MSILNLSEVSRQFQVNRSTVYKAIKAGRLSRRSDGNFDLVEVIRCFGEPTGQHTSNQDTVKGSTTQATQVDTEVVALLKQQISDYKNRENEYKERENRLLDQIDRMQTLLEYKNEQQEKATYSTSDTTQVDTEVVAPNKYNLNKENQNLNSINEESEKMECSQNMLPKHVDSQQKATVAIPQVNVAQKHERKRGLFGRIVQAVFDAD